MARGSKAQAKVEEEKKVVIEDEEASEVEENSEKSEQSDVEVPAPKKKAAAEKKPKKEKKAAAEKKPKAKEESEPEDEEESSEDAAPAKKERKPRVPFNLATILATFQSGKHDKGVEQLSKYILKFGEGGKKKRVQKELAEGEEKQLTHYQKFIQEKMLHLKNTTELNGKERMAEAVRLWNEEKAAAKA